MGSSGIAGLKCLQWLFRGVQFCAALAILAIYSYFLAALMHANNQQQSIPTTVKAVEGIAAIATAYALLGVLFVCCCAGHPATSFIALVIDIGLVGAYIFVAVANKAGAGDCSSSSGSVLGSAGNAAGTKAGPVTLPGVSGVVACRLQTACLAAACLAILFLLLSLLLEFKMNRSRYRASRPLRDPDGEYITKSDYFNSNDESAAAAAAVPQRRHAGRRPQFLSRFTRRNYYRGVSPTRQPMMNPDALPLHQQPNQMQTRQVPAPEQWGEVRDVNDDDDALVFNEARSQQEPVRFTATTAPKPAAEMYEEGDALGEYNLYHGGDGEGAGAVNGLAETGRMKQRENRAARVERFANA